MTYNNISRAAWTAAQQRLQVETGVVVDTDQGQVTQQITEGFLKGAITFSWAYDEAAQQLTASCVAKPWWAPESTIDVDLTNLVEGQ